MLGTYNDDEDSTTIEMRERSIWKEIVPTMRRDRAERERRGEDSQRAIDSRVI